MNDLFRIRNYKEGDFLQVADLWQESGMGGRQRGDNEEIILETVRNGGTFFILEDAFTCKIIGTSWLTNDRRRLYLHHFAIAENYQGKKLSHLLLKNSLEFVKDTGLQVKLEVHKNNFKAINLYLKHGFKDLGDYQVYIIRDVQNLNI